MSSSSPTVRSAPIPDPVARRLSLYLRQLEELSDRGLKVITSKQLAESLNLTPAQVRSDFGFLEHPTKIGCSGRGYSIVDLITLMRQTLGTNRTWEVVLVGAGNLGRALMTYSGFKTRGFEMVGVFDIDPRTRDGLEVRPMSDLISFVRGRGVPLAMIAVPAKSAQEVADMLAAAGVEGLLNFAPIALRAPSNVSIKDVDIALPLEQLAFDVNRRRGAREDKRVGSKC